MLFKTDRSQANHPDDILRDKTLSQAEKRAILASWASDARAVSPTLRQLESGAVVELDVILRALRTLDGQKSISRLVRPILTRDDDDDPPPCPASSGLPLPPRFVPAFGRQAA